MCYIITTCEVSSLHQPYMVKFKNVINTMSSLTVGADFLAALVASCLRGAFPPVDLRAVCFVLAILIVFKNKNELVR